MTALLTVLALAGCGGGGSSDEPPAGPPPLPRFVLSSFAADSRLVGRRLDQLVLRPKQGARGRPLLVLLHGAGADPSMYLDPTLFRAVRRLRERAPIVVLANGGPTSYFHNRRGERWGVLHPRRGDPAGRGTLRR